MSRRVVGLEISSDAIRFALVTRNFRGAHRLKKSGTFPIEASVDANGRIVDSGVLVTQLKDLWKKEKLNTNKVALGLGGSDVFVREFKVPEMSTRELSSALPSLATSELPMPTSELVLDFYPIRALETADGKRLISGLLTAALRSSVESLISVVETAKLFPFSLDLVPFAIARNMAKDISNDEVVMLVHASHGVLNMVVTHGQVPAFVRIVPFGVSANVESQAQVGIVQDGYVESPSPTNDQWLGVDPTAELQTIQDPSEIALKRIKETFTFYNQNHPDKPVTKALVAGLAETEDNWRSSFEDLLGLPLEIQNPPSKRRRKSELVSSDLLIPYALALG